MPQSRNGGHRQDLLGGGSAPILCSALPLGEDFVRAFLQTYTDRLLSVKKRCAYSFPSKRFI